MCLKKENIKKQIGGGKMPIYEYKCLNCGQVNEYRLSMKELGKVDLQCRECDSHNLKRIFSAPNIGGLEKKTLIGGLEKKTLDSCPTGTCPLTKK